MHVVPASLLSADGEEEEDEGEGEGKTERERGGGKGELYPSLTLASTSLPCQPSSPENDEEDQRTTELGE